jgi:hypothetical protein
MVYLPSPSVDDCLFMMMSWTTVCCGLVSPFLTKMHPIYFLNRDAFTYTNVICTTLGCDKMNDGSSMPFFNFSVFRTVPHLLLSSPSRCNCTTDPAHHMALQTGRSARHDERRSLPARKYGDGKSCKRNEYCGTVHCSKETALERRSCPSQPAPAYSGPKMRT